MTDADIEIIQSVTFCTREEAISSLKKYLNPIEAISALYAVPDAPKKHVWDTNLSEEQREICQKGRDLQEKVNAVFSVAHQQVKSSKSAEQEQVLQEQSVSVPVEVVSE